MFNFDDLARWIVPSAFVLGGLIAGLFFELVIFKFLIKMVKGTKWKWDDILVTSFKRAFIVWATCLGGYFALVSVEVDPDVQHIIEMTLVALITLMATLVLARMAAGFVMLAVARTEGKVPTASLLSNAVKVIILVIGIVFILQGMGISITPLIGALGIGGLATALALQDTLSNLFSGVQIIASRQVRPGDYVMLDSGETGYVTDVKWRNTTIKDFTDNLIIIPNSKLAGAIITNYNLPAKNLWAEVFVGVHYDSDLEHVERVAIETANETFRQVMGEEPAKEPRFHYLEFADSSINCRVRIHVKQFRDKLNVQHAYIKNLHKRFQKEGIVIPFPIRTVYMEKTP
jgi:small-conductance mechanosensitive channel